MKVLLLFSAFIGASLSTNLDDEWEKWKSLYSKVYDDEAAESVRRLVWEDNWRFVQQHNSEGHSYEVEMNEFADLVSRTSHDITWYVRRLWVGLTDTYIIKWRKVWARVHGGILDYKQTTAPRTFH